MRCGGPSGTATTEFQDGTISTEVAIIADSRAYYHDIVTAGLPLSNDGKPVPSRPLLPAVDPKRGEEYQCRQRFSKYLIQP
jgi:hypothetical protein